MTVSTPAKSWWIPALLVAALALAAYAPALQLPFVSLDDRNYVTANPMVQRGLTADGWAWAWTTLHAANWHPLTWLSLMLDAEAGGGSARAFHLTNVLLHAANAALVFLFLRRATATTLRSFFVAAVFALHPLRVESVAWVAERKDVLSALFGFAAILVYASPRPGGSRHIPAVAVLLAASLLAKPTFVTAPLLLLLLDFWPLGRAARMERWSPLIREKWPLLVLSGASCAISLVAQQRGGALRSAADIPLWPRIENAALATVAYLRDFVAPAKLAVYYPHPRAAVPALAALAASAAVAAVSVLAWRSRRTRPFVLTGWLWYLVALAPVAGIVQVGLQARADRYTYVALVGIAIVVAWGVPDLLGVSGVEARPRARAALGAAATIAVVALCFALTRRQLRFWESDVALYTRALAVTENNDLAHAALGAALAPRGDYDGARRHLDEALRLRPDAVEARHERAVLHLREGQPERAAALWHALLNDSPRFVEARAGLATALVALGDFDAADRESSRALAESPDLAEALAARGAVRLAQKRPADAEPAFRAAIASDPQCAECRVGLGNALAGLGRAEEAITAYRDALRVNPTSYAAQLPLGALLFEKGQGEEGLAHLQEAVRLAPDRPEAQLNLGVALYKLGRVEEAKACFERARQAAPQDERAAAFLRLAERPPAPAR